MSWCSDFIAILSSQIEGSCVNCEWNFWTLEHDCEPKIVKQMQSVSTTPSKAENSDDDADGNPWDLRIPSLFFTLFFSCNQTRENKLLTLFKHFDWILERAMSKYFCWQTSYDLFYDDFLYFLPTHKHDLLNFHITSRDDTEEKSATYWQHTLPS